MNKILKLFLFLLFFIGAGMECGEAKLNIFDKPRYIPEINFYGDSGRTYKLSDFNADLLLVMIWSRHCGPCINDLESMNNFAKKVSADGIKVILLSPEDEWESVEERRAFLKRFRAPNLVNYSDRKSMFSKGLGIMVTPTVLLVNKYGQEVGQITGSTQWDSAQVIRYIRKLKEGLY